MSWPISIHFWRLEAARTMELFGIFSPPGSDLPAMLDEFQIPDHVQNCEVINADLRAIGCQIKAFFFYRIWVRVWFRVRVGLPLEFGLFLYDYVCSFVRARVVVRVLKNKMWKSDRITCVIGCIWGGPGRATGWCIRHQRMVSALTPHSSTVRSSLFLRPDSRTFHGFWNCDFSLGERGSSALYFDTLYWRRVAPQSISNGYFTNFKNDLNYFWQI